MTTSILIIDDEQDFLETVRRGLHMNGFKDLTLLSDPSQAIPMIQAKHFDIALIDITMPRIDGVTLLNLIKNTNPEIECIMITAINEARIAVDCLKQGAYDYLVKPFDRENLCSSIYRALERKKLLEIMDLSRKPQITLKHPKAFQGLVTQSQQMHRILKEAELHAASNVPILITGESGTGKELLAQAIHACSPRHKCTFMPINMASLTSTLFDSEFFGHTRGAFTGAERDHSGHLEQAHGGTLFLDEIGIMPLELQGKLLRVLQEGEYFKIGASRPQKSDVRIIAATNEDLEQLMAKGLFRKDLYYRLRGAWLNLPPLRSRKEDIPLLVKSFLAELGSSTRPPIDENALKVLNAYHFPGNVRELKSLLQAAVNLTQGQVITVRHLPEHIRTLFSPALPKPPQNTENNPATLNEIEKKHILSVYAHTGRNKSQTAKILDVGLNTLRRKLASYGID